MKVMNEPQGITALAWKPYAQAAITPIREAGATNRIYLGGVGWSGAHNFVSTGWADVVTSITDSGNNMALEVHQYADSNNSGSSPTASSGDILVNRVKEVTMWARIYGYKLFLGEFNTGDRASIVVDDTEYTALVNLFNYLKANADVWEGATMWAAGPWWGDYIFNVEPNNSVDDIRYTRMLDIKA